MAVSELNREQLLEKELYVNGIEAILVSVTGIVDYKGVAEKIADIIRQSEETIINEAEVSAISEKSNE